MKKTKDTNKGITLIALVITIIVMLILVAVTITMAVNGGLFEYAGSAGSQTNAARDAEQEFANLQPNMTYEQLIDKYTTLPEGGEGGNQGGSDTTEITFTIDGVQYKALSGMKWKDWCASEEYNKDGFKFNEVAGQLTNATETRCLELGIYANDPISEGDYFLENS